jgi:hypothetical protein
MLSAGTSPTHLAFHLALLPHIVPDPITRPPVRSAAFQPLSDRLHALAGADDARRFLRAAADGMMRLARPSGNRGVCHCRTHTSWSSRNHAALSRFPTIPYRNCTMLIYTRWMFSLFMPHCTLGDYNARL